MILRVLAFARLRELLGFGERSLDVPPGSRVRDVWALLCREQTAIAAFERSTRFARNGALVQAADLLAEGDELALLPPVGGG